MFSKLGIHDHNLHLIVSLTFDRRLNTMNGALVVIVFAYLGVLGECWKVCAGFSESYIKGIEK